MTWESKRIAGRSTVAQASAGDRAALARATAPCLPSFSDRRLKPAPLERHLVRLPRVAFGRQRASLNRIGLQPAIEGTSAWAEALRFITFLGSPAEAGATGTAPHAS